MITGLPFSFTGHAKDIYRESLNPAGLLARKLRRRRSSSPAPAPTVDTCGAGAEADVHLVYHGLNADFARLLESAGNGPRPGAGAPALLRVVERRPAGAEEGLRRAARARRAAPRPRASTLELVIAGETGRRDPGDPRAASPSSGSATSSTCSGRAARPSCSAVPARPRSSPWPAGSPTTATATASPTCSSRRWRRACRSSPPRCPASPSWSATARTGCSSRRRPRRPGRRARPAGARPRPAGAPRRAGPATVAARLRRRRRAPDGEPARGGEPMTGPMTDPRGADAGPARPFVCVIDDLHRDLAVAADARAGRFTHAGLRLRSAGRPTGCDGGPAHDEEWRIEWVKLYEGLDLAHAYVEHADPDSLAAWEDLVESLLRPGAGRARHLRRVRAPHPELALRLAALRRGADLARSASRSGRAAERAPAGRRRAPARAPHAGAQPPHARALRAAGAGPRLRTRRAGGRGRGRARRERRHRHLPRRGAPRVLHRLPHDRAALLRRRHRQRTAGRDPRPAGAGGADARLCDFALHVQRPDGWTPALSDGDPGDYRTLLRRAGELLDRPDLLWAASGGAEGSPPATRAASFPVGGYHVQRSGWGDAAGLRRRAVERPRLRPARRRRPRPLRPALRRADGRRPPPRRRPRPLHLRRGRQRLAAWFKGTAAHNTVTVDGLDQTPYRRGKPKGPISIARLLWRRTEPGLDALCGRG